jgi:probable rRNA maturation factor
MKINITNYFNDESYDSLIQDLGRIASNKLQLQNESMNVILMDNKSIQDMNKNYRNKDYATDVLTFPDGSFHHLGDVFISLEKCKEQADEYGHSFDRELGFLVIHGLLHTLGYDHQTKEEETQMFSLQEQILRKAKLNR